MPKSVGNVFWRKQDLAAIVRRWSKYVPIEHICVVTVPPTGSPSSLLPERFGSVIGVDLSALPPLDVTNPALGAPSAELMRRLNVRTENWDDQLYRLAFKNATAHSVLEPRAKHEPKVSLSKEDMTWVRRRSERMIRWIDASGVRVVGDLNDLVPTIEVPESPVDPGGLSDAEMLEVAEYTIVGLAKLIAEFRVEHRQLANAFPRVDPIDTASDEWREFTEIEAVAEQRADGVLPGSQVDRFLIWRVGNRQAEKEARPGSGSGNIEDAPPDSHG